MNWYKKAQEVDYKGLHTAPTKDVGCSLDNLSSTYPEDIYSSEGARYYGHYGHGHPQDMFAVSVIRSCRNHPSKPVRVYRAVPYNPSPEEKINDLENQKRYILKNGKIPPNAKTTLTNSSRYFDYLCDEINKLKTLPTPDKMKFEINAGDWVTINRDYAKEHGESNLGGNYKIISKVVKAKDLYSDGDSIQEWGYNP